MNTLFRHTDDELVSLYVGGLNEAFDTLLLRHKDRLFSYILANVHDEDLANDIFQETFVKVIICLREERYTQSGKFYSWLTCIARNLIVDSFRARQTNETALRQEMLQSLLDKPHELEENREYEINRCLNEMKGLVDALPETQQEVVRMHYFENMSFKDIAVIKGMSINTALGRMHYAINNMRRMAVKRNFQPYV